MKIKIERNGITAEIEDMWVISNDINLSEEMQSIIDSCKLKETAGLSLMHLVLNEIAQSKIYTIINIEGFGENEKKYIY